MEQVQAMLALDNCISNARRLIRSLEEEQNDITACLGGEMLEEYRSMLKYAIDQTQSIRKQLQNIQNSLL